MLTLTLGGSKDLVQLAQWPLNFNALDLEAERADFGRMASKAAELADLLRVLRGSVLTKRPAVPKVSWMMLGDEVWAKGIGKTITFF